MIFTDQAQKILHEWILDFDATPIPKNPIQPYKPVKHASLGGETHMTNASIIVEVALSHIENRDVVVEGHPHPPEIQLQSAHELANEAEIVLADIEKHYGVEVEDGFIRMIKKGSLTHGNVQE